MRKQSIVRMTGLEYDGYVDFDQLNIQKSQLEIRADSPINRA